MRAAWPATAIFAEALVGARAILGERAFAAAADAADAAFARADGACATDAFVFRAVWDALEHHVTVCDGEAPADSPRLAAIRAAVFLRYYSPRVAAALRSAAPAAGNDTVAPAAAAAAAKGEEDYYSAATERRLVALSRRVCALPSEMLLPGWGVELALRNLEYLTTDDPQAADDSGAEGAADEGQSGSPGPGDDEDEVKGFLFGVLRRRKPQLAAQLDIFRSRLLANEEQLEDLKVWQLRDLGFSAAQRIASSPSPLKLAAEIAQDFPTVAVGLSRIKPNATFRAECERSGVKPGTEAIYVNGQHMSVASLDPFRLYEAVVAENRKADALERITGMALADAEAILNIQPDRPPSPASASRSPDRFAVTVPEIVWLNDLETDQEYMEWPQSVQVVMQQLWPGSLHAIGLNLYTVVTVANLNTARSFSGALAALAATEGVLRRYPVRQGVLFVAAPDSPGGRFARAFARFMTASPLRSSGRHGALQMTRALLSACSESLEVQGDAGEDTACDVSDSDVAAAFSSIDGGDFEATIGEPSLGEWLGASNAAAERLGLADPAASPIAFMNGIPSHGGTPAEALQGALSAVFPEMGRLQNWVREGRLRDGHPSLSVPEQILDSADPVWPRYSERIFPGPHSAAAGRAGGTAAAPFGERGAELAHTVYFRLPYFENDVAQDTVRSVAVQVAGDLASPEFRATLRGALAALADAEGDVARAARVALVHCPRTADAGNETAAASAAAGGGDGAAAGEWAAASILAAGATQPARAARLFAEAVLARLDGVAGVAAVGAALDAADARAILEGLGGDAGERDPEGLAAAFPAALVDAREVHPRLCTEWIGGVLGRRGAHAAAAAEEEEVPDKESGGGGAAAAVVANGRIIPLDAHEEFGVEDHHLLAAVSRRGHARAVLEAVERARFPRVDADELDTARLSAVAAFASSVVEGGFNSADGFGRRSRAPPVPVGLVPSATVGPAHAGVCILAVLDPLGVAMQRAAPLLEMLAGVFPTVRVELVLSPTELSGPPLTSFFRTALSTEIDFDVDGNFVGPAATFGHLPSRRLLTLNLAAPEGWLASLVRAKHDLDNIILADLGATETLVHATFELEHVLLQGNCFDTADGSPPAGLEIVLTPLRGGGGDVGVGGVVVGAAAPEKVVDTIVMSNYGYFQLKANPGRFFLHLKPHTKSSAAYEIVDEETGGAVVGKVVEVSDFGGGYATLVVRKREGHEHEHLLLEEGDLAEPQDTTAQSLLEMLLGVSAPAAPAARPAPANVSDDETIHVFSLASGLLYERFLRIMMLSVVRNTRNPVKFWLLANFLSPRFKQFLPFMARELNFSVELVTYKWPMWLNKQTEKQRIIWGYKILFLDVLFPLDLRRVVYVDADQVVRADLRELWGMDIHGAPYAYTPFCDDRPEMEGFKFWKKGFWAGHLRGGRNYHISALYLVDLVQFRKLSSGDTLRSTYDQLSQDPNSLANLDQDLPNYLQHQVRIFSLPQEWLYCDTWCYEERRATAKTIDLCNNPMTKEPKLQSAVRIISEWTSLDEGVRTVWNRWERSVVAAEAE